jgi:hypothetical protein
MTVANILPEVLAECGVDLTSPSIADNNFQMRQILSLMNTAGKDINRRAEWTKAAASFTVANASSQTLPADFQEMSDAGAVIWGLSGHVPVRPCLSPELWQLFEKFPPTQPYYMLRDGKIYFTETIGSEGAEVRYVSTNWIPGKAAITTDTDQPIFPDSLLARATIWRWKRQKGLPYDDILAEYEADLDAAVKADRGAA